ncbi:MAG: MFS transporter [Lewinellaceae bacterium]|nr:MFS transporter [Lewinellaceae bacterium]
MLFRLYAHWRESYSGIPTRIWLLSLVSLVNRCGSMVVIFLTIYLTKHLGYGLEDAGYVLGCFGAGALLGTYIGGGLADRFGYYPVMIWSLLLNGAMLILLIWIQSFWMMCAAVFVLSVVADGFRPANSVAIARYSIPENRTRSISLYRMSINLGWAVAPALGGLMVGLGWHWLFVADGITCILAAILLWLFMAPAAGEQPGKHVHTEHAHREKAPAAVSPYRDRPFLAFVFFTTINAIVFMQFLWTVPVYFKDAYHWDEATIGLVTAINGLLVFLIEMPLIYNIEGRRSRLQYVRLGLVLYVVAYLAFVFPPGGLVTALIFIVAISFGEMFVMPFSSNFVFGYAAKGSAGGYMALYGIAYSVANIIAPLLGTQVIARWGYHTLWYLLGALAVISWVGFWVLEKKTEGAAPRANLSVETL